MLIDLFPSNAATFDAQLTDSLAGIYTLQNVTGLHDTARLFALLNMAMTDGWGGLLREADARALEASCRVSTHTVPAGPG